MYHVFFIDAHFPWRISGAFSTMGSTLTILQSLSTVLTFACGFGGGLVAKIVQQGFVAKLLNLAAAGGKTLLLNPFFYVLSRVCVVLIAAGAVHLLPSGSGPLSSHVNGFPLGPVIAYASLILLVAIHLLVEHKTVKKVVPKDKEREPLLNSSKESSIQDGSIGSEEDDLARYLRRSSSLSSAIVLSIGLGFHSFLAGLGLGAQGTVTQLLKIFGPILAHKSLAGLALGSSLVRAQVKTHIFYTVLTFFSLATPLGIVTGLVVSNFVDGDVWEATCICIAAGTFLYISLVDIMPQVLDAKMTLCKVASQVLALTLGFGLMASLAIWI